MDYLLSPRQVELRDRVRAWAEAELAPLAPELDETDEVSPRLVEMLAGQGLFHQMMPEAYGGPDRIRCVDACLVREELTRICGQADEVFTMQALSAYPIIGHGTSEQKERYLPPVAQGLKLAAFALSEPEAGSDVAGLRTAAVPDGDGYVLNGEKQWISQAPEADIFVVFAKTDPEAGGRGLTAFIVERGTPGLISEERVSLMAAHSVGRMVFRDCRVPGENLLGRPGQGMGLALDNLDMFRPTVGAAAVGLARRAYEEALGRSKARMAFGRPLAGFQATQFKLADMATDIQAARLLVFHAAVLKDRGDDPAGQIKAASMAKLFATEACHRVVDEAVQIHGGSGLLKGVTVERLYRMARLMRIYEGTSEIQRLTIARAILKE
ncbi:MAG: acyl-CoA dehydrogenase family protein [Proteobacteria bacterium]|nr:acyl-CoA dehydrogenase family protein [Pseudomonadota bacterium]